MDGTLSPDKNYVVHGGKWVPAQLSPSHTHYAYDGQWHLLKSHPVPEKVEKKVSKFTFSRGKKIGAIIISLSILSAGLYVGIIDEAIESFVGEDCSEDSSKDFAYLDLSYNDMRFANLSHSDFSNANLGHVDLTGADLCNAKFDGAEMGRAVLIGADLTGVDFSKTELDYSFIQATNLLGCPSALPNNWECVNTVSYTHLTLPTILLV